MIIAVLGLFCFILLDSGTSPQSGTYWSGRGLGFLLFFGICGMWAIVRGVIYLIRALSGNERYAKRVEDVMDKFESRNEAMITKQVGSASTRHNVLVLLGWVFLFLAIAGAIFIGYLYLTRPR